MRIFRGKDELFVLSPNFREFNYLTILLKIDYFFSFLGKQNYVDLLSKFGNSTIFWKKLTVIIFLNQPPRQKIATDCAAKIVFITTTYNCGQLMKQLRAINKFWMSLCQGNRKIDDRVVVLGEKGSLFKCRRMVLFLVNSLFSFLLL